jgi:hypothetical protein
MKNLILIIAFTFIVSIAFTQSDNYFTAGTETIFSLADVDYEKGGTNNILRFVPFINFHGYYNIDFSEKVGIYTGLGFRNVGYILDKYIDEEGVMVKKKFRTYNLGIPLGIKIGNLKKAFIYGGYEVELPFHYKEKTFIDEKKEKFTTWFSDRVEQFQHGFFVGLQLPYGANIKFKYYLSEFHNQSYTESSGFKPYDGLSSNIFYFSLTFNMIKDGKFNSEYY